MTSFELHFPGAGHSLGGALANLAAYDIAKAFPSADVSVYSFGAPRTGKLTGIYKSLAIAASFLLAHWHLTRLSPPFDCREPPLCARKMVSPQQLCAPATFSCLPFPNSRLELPTESHG